MTTLVGKNGKPLGKPFVIPNLKQQNAPSIKNIPVQVAVSKKKTNGVDNKHIKHEKITTDVKNDETKHNVAVNKQPAKELAIKEKIEVNSKKVKNDKTSKSSSTKQSQSIIANNNWWDNKNSESNDPILVFPEEQPWFNAYPSFVGEQLQVITDSVKGDDKRYSQLSISISEIYNAEVSRHTKSQGGKGNTDEKWINDVIKSGTLSDKVAALALRVQEAPFYQLETLDLLVAMACKKEQRTSQLALEAVKDLLMNNLLPDRKLTTFKTPLLFHSNMTLSTGLLLWFEGQLKLRIERVMEALDNGLKSNVDYFKKLCLETASSLLMSKPEQEARLLTMIVNKLGDPSSKICSKCIEVLKGVVRVHPAMKLVIVREVRQFIYRPNIKLKSIFNGVIFLSQINLMPGDHLVATQLVECYVSLFEKAVKEDELGSRLLSALLTGINKSFPFLDNIEPIVKYADSLFRLVHTASFTSSTQALMLLSHIAISASAGKDGKKKNKATVNKKSVSADDSMMTEDGEDEASEGEDGETEAEAEDAGSDLMRRYYRALYAKLLSDQVTSRAKNTLLLNLMYRSIKRDPSDHRAMAFLKRLSICATQSSPSIAAGLLFLVSEVLDSRPNLKALLSKTEEASIHTTAAEHLAGVDEEEAHQMLGNFDGSKREPEYAALARPSLWETALMRRHFHPSVQAFAHSLLESPSHKINFAGDPTTDFSLMAFLNRFAYKNPKKSVADKIQNRRAATQSEEPLNMSKFIRTEETDVAPDKQFFYKFFGEREKLRETGRARDRSKRKKSKRGSDDEDDDDEEDGDDGEDGSVDGDDKKPSKKGSRALDPDEEAEMDAFADKLAEDLMRSADNTYDMDPDMDDFSEDEEDEGDDNSDIDSQGDVEEEDEASEDDSDLDDEDAFGPQESEEEEEEEEKPKKGAKKSSKSKSIDSKAMDFADFLAEQRQTSKDDAPKSKKTKGKKGQLQSESEDSDDGYSGLQAYDEAMDEDLAPKKKGEKKTPAAAAAAKMDKKSALPTAAKKVSAKEQEDMEAMEFDEDGNADWSDLEDDDEESESSPPTKKGKAAAKKTNKRDKFAAQDSDDSYDEDAEFDLMLGEDSVGANKKSSKKANSKRKRKGGDDGGDFASAEDYEEEMDAILQQIQQHNAGGGESLQVGKGGAKKAFGSKKSRK